MSDRKKRPQPTAEAQPVAVCGERPSESFGPRFTPEEWDRLGKLPPGTKLYTAPPSAPVGVERKHPVDGNGDDDAYNRGWNDCLDALTQQPAAGIFNRIRQTPEYAREMEKLASALGYQNAFHEVAAMLDIPAQPLSPKEVWETQMRPKLLALTSQQPAAVDEAMVERINQRFTSGNSVQVERAHITAEEWQALSVALAAKQGGRSDD